MHHHYIGFCGAATSKSPWTCQKECKILEQFWVLYVANKLKENFNWVWNIFKASMKIVQADSNSPNCLCGDHSNDIIIKTTSKLKISNFEYSFSKVQIAVES